MSHLIEDEVFGLLVHDKWGDLVTLRKFAGLPEFARSEDEAFEEDVPLVDSWQRHIPILAPRAREFVLRGSLHRAGVFEVHVTTDGAKTPTAEQRAAFQTFVANEGQVCRNVVNAMLRFYGAIDRTIGFPKRVDVTIPVNPDVTALANVLQFDCLTLPQTVVLGISPLVFNWRPAWDEEHGLKSLVYRGEVIAVGTDEVDEMECWPSDECFSLVWNREVMTPAEIAAYEAYRDNHPKTRGGGMLG
jgi:hypothetical protein